MIKLIRNTLIVATLVFITLSVAVQAEEVGAPDPSIVNVVAKHASCLSWAQEGRLQSAKLHWDALGAVPDTYQYFKLYYTALGEGFLAGYAKAQFEEHSDTALLNFGGNYNAYVAHIARTLYAVNCKQGI